MTTQLNTEIIVTSPVLMGDIGRDIYVTRHAFAAPETLWVSDIATIAEIVDIAFANPDLAALALVNVDGVLIQQEDWATIPAISARVDVYIPAQKGVLRGIIRAIVVFATIFVVFVLTFNGALAVQAGLTIGNFLGGLLANALVPPPSNDNGNIEAPKIYSIEGLRNRARPGEPFNLILGKRRVFPDIIVPPYQEIVGDDIYIRTGLCWGAHDIALSDFKISETVIGNFDGVQIQPPNGLPLLSTTPTPTLIPGIISPQSFAIDLADEAIWSSRTTAPDAEEIEIILFFPEGVGWLKKGKDKRRISPPVGVEIRYRETGTATWRTTSAADTEQADLAAVGLGSLTRREMFVDLGVTFIDQFHTAIPTGNVSLIRTYDRSAPGEPFPASIKFAVPPGKQYDVEVRRLNAPKGTDDVFEDITWTAMNTWKAGNPFPDAAAAVTAVRVKGSDQLSGVVDTFNGICEALVPVYTPPAGGTANATAASWSGSAVSSNGADVLLFVTRGTHQANPTPDTEIDWPAFAEFWEWCDTQGFTFDYVENTARRKGDLQQLIGSACRARILRINGLLTPVIDRAQPAGNRTILTPDNAADFVFRKSFPPEVHAIDINFANKDTNYRNDERRIYVDGYTAQTAEKFEPFNLPGVVDADLIFRHARYFIKSSQLQVFGGGASQDIEGRMVLRFGDRIGVQHSTLAITSESGRVKEIFTDGTGNITGFRLSEKTDVNTTDQFVARIRRITDNAGEGDITAAVVDDLTVITTETTDTFTFTTAISPVGGPEVGALAVVGVKNNEIIDGLVQGIDALDDEAKSVNIEWTLYAPARFVEDVIPGHTPLTPPDLIPRPLTPVIDSVRAINEGIFIAFTQPPKADVTITGFAVSFRETPDAGATANWQDRPDLLPTARNFHLPAGRPGQFFDVQIVALAQGGVRSDPVIQTGIAAYNVVVPPTTPVVVPIVRVGPGGSRIPVVSVSVDPEDDALFETLLIETRTVADPVWRTATTASADNPVKDITGLVPGATYDFRLAWKNIRGAITPEVDRPIVVGVLVADDLISTDTQSVAGTPAAAVVSDIADLTTIYGDTLSASDSADIAMWLDADEAWTFKTSVDGFGETANCTLDYQLGNCWFTASSVLTYGFDSACFMESGASVTESTALSVTRATTGTAENLDGTVTSFAANIARRVSGVGLLIEPDATNLVPNSDFTDAVWNKRGTVTVTAGQTDPMGGSAAYLISGIDAKNDGDIFDVMSGLPSGRSEPSISLLTPSQSGTLVLANPQNEALGRWDIDLSLMGSGWERITRDHVAVTIIVEFSDSSNSGGIHLFAPIAALTSGITVWRPQLEAGEISTSPIKTTGTPATRDADVVEIPNVPATLSLMNDYIVVIDVDIPDVKVTGAIFLISNNNGADNVILIPLHSTNGIQLQTWVAGTPTTFTPAVTTNGRHKIALGLASDGALSIAIDGTEYPTSLSVADRSSYVKAWLAATYFGGSQKTQTHRDFQILAETITTTRLQELSTV